VLELGLVPSEHFYSIEVHKNCFAASLESKCFIFILKFFFNVQPVMFVFQMASQILHNIVQIDELKYSLEKHNCCEVVIKCEDLPCLSLFHLSILRSYTMLLLIQTINYCELFVY